MFFFTVKCVYFICTIRSWFFYMVVFNILILLTQITFYAKISWFKGILYVSYIKLLHSTTWKTAICVILIDHWKFVLRFGLDRDLFVNFLFLVQHGRRRGASNLNLVLEGYRRSLLCRSFSHFRHRLPAAWNRIPHYKLRLLTGALANIGVVPGSRRTQPVHPCLDSNSQPH